MLAQRVVMIPRAHKTEENSNSCNCSRLERLFHHPVCLFRVTKQRLSIGRAIVAVDAHTALLETTTYRQHDK
eukprot:2302845-Rhodomonas_salina.1